MQTPLVVIDTPAQWKPYCETDSVITVARYLQDETLSSVRHLVINLSGDLSYHSEGYYCSLLAQARGHKVLPEVETINRLENQALPRLEEPLRKSVLRWLQGSGPVRYLDLFFGVTGEASMERVARRIFEQFPCPLLRVEFSLEGNGQVAGVRALGLHELDDPRQTLFADALDRFSKKVWRQPRNKKPARFDLAILHDPAEKMPPSDKGALQTFLAQAKKMNINAELITPMDGARLMEFDALFIRQTTAVNHATFRLAQRAAQADMVVIDDPLSIIRCTNKVYLKELLVREEVAIPKSDLIFKAAPEEYEAVVAELGSPMVLKVPDGSFSFGVKKVNDKEEYQATLDALFQQSAIVLAQEYLPTEFDWRIGVLGGEPLYACKYFMARGHWQIYNHEGGRSKSGGFETVPVQQVPKSVVKTAVKAAGLIGKGLYGVDLKQIGDRCVVIEVNDNPSLDQGVEDAILGDELYRMILREFADRLERRQRLQP